jgi:3,4-dihydroxy 2-butanone 4-phosphate synthase/GTP cyclohydrolase II
MSGLIKKLSKSDLKTKLGDFEIHVFHDGREEAIALTKGELAGGQDIFCRIHSECILSQEFQAIYCDCRGNLEEAMKTIAKNKRGILIYLYQVGRSNGMAAQVEILPLKHKGYTNSSAYKTIGFPEDARTYDIAAKILNSFRIRSVHLSGSNRTKKETLEKYGIKVKLNKKFVDRAISLGVKSQNFVDDVQECRDAPPFPPSKDKKRVFVTGESSFDQIYKLLIPQEIETIAEFIGGPLEIICRAMCQTGLSPTLFTHVGDDSYGCNYFDKLRTSGFNSLVSFHRNKTTTQSGYRAYA